MMSLGTLVSESESLKNWLATEGGHPRDEIQIWSGCDLHTDSYRIDVFCTGCERRWTTAISNQMMYDCRLDNKAFLKAAIIPFFKKIAGTLCYRFSLVAELAEWLTKRVAEAGAKGVKYSALVAEAEHEHLCDARDVDAMLERLGFRMDFGAAFTVSADITVPMMVETARIGGRLIHDGWVTLPLDHPLRGAK